MNQKKGESRRRAFVRFFRPSMRLYFAILVIFSAAALYRQDWILGAAELLVVLLLLLYTHIVMKNQEQRVLHYVGSAVEDHGQGNTNAIMSLPLPLVIFSLHDGNVLWSNESFLQITAEREHMFEIGMADMLPGFSLQWLAEGHAVSPVPAELDGRKYRVYGNVFRINDRSDPDAEWGVLYFADVTEYEQTAAEYAASRPVVAVIMLDNYEELIKNLNETTKSPLLAAIDHRISAWCEGTQGYLCRYDRDRYIFIFEERYLQRMIDGRFSLLDTVRELQNPGGIAATVSIGVGRGGDTLDEGYQFAMLGIEMALSRGGDQAVIKSKLNFEFYGGKTAAVERHTKVKSRVMASAMGELMSDASNLIVMGHRFSDLDSLGAAVAICCIARKKGVPARIAVDPDENIAKQIISRLKRTPEYESCFVRPADALQLVEPKTLLVVVDTNRPDQVESQELLAACNKIAIVDHHRRAADYISNAALNFHEPYASSACELGTELLQYLVDSSNILKVEAEAILAGIVLDTKNFTMRTGSRTFEAAAFLRRSGSDTTEVKKLFQNDLESTIAKYAVVQRAHMYRGGVAIAECVDTADRIVAAQAADDLINITGIEASFVIYGGEGTINISARSLGSVNVQIIVEKLGGGGNQSTAGAQLRGMGTAEALKALRGAVDDYFDKDRGTEAAK